MNSKTIAAMFASFMVPAGVTFASAVLNGKADYEITQSTNKAIGTVVGEDGEPIIGASIKLKGSKAGVVTNLDGQFTLGNVPIGSTIEISYIGYEATEVKWNGTSVRVVLHKNDKLLDELVVVGYGTQKKANLTGSVSSIGSEALATRPVSSVSAAIAGEMPGVTAVQSSGAPGSQAASITIRGKNSINAASPLVIVDGVPGSMNVLDPADIESFTVLKDASSAAIYGVQAANGVILITTKTGKKGKTKVDYSGTFSWSSLLAKRDLVNAYEYAILYNEATKNESPNSPAPFTDETIEKYRTGELPSTDWYKEALKKNAFEQIHNVTISGGNDKTVYNASLGYTYQDGLSRDFDYRRYNARVNVQSDINKWLSAGVNASGYRGITNDAWNGFVTVMQGITRMNATQPVYNEDGSYYYGGRDNPVAIQGDKSGFRKNIAQEFNLNTQATLHLLPGLNVKGVYNVRQYLYTSQNFKKNFSYGNDASRYDSGLREGSHNYYDYNYYTGQLLGTYDKTFGKHTLGVLAGMESYKVTYKYTTASRKGGGSNELGESLNSLDASSQKNTDGGYVMTRLSYFGRIQYNYAGKYLFEANLRRDASSRFPKEGRWGTFPSVSAGWRISEESFFKNNISWVNNLKVRFGWGRTGNEELAADDIYPSVPTYAYDTSNLMMFNNTLYSTVTEARLVNYNLRWAKVDNIDFGLEGSLFNNKLSFELSVYKKKTNGMLLYLPIQGVIGMSAPAQNVGSIQNKGFDFQISHNNQINKDWSYQVSLNFAYVKNEVLDMAGTSGQTSDAKIWNLEGYPINSYYGYIANGYFNTEEELKTYPKRTGSEKLGDIKYVDLNGDGKITAEGDRAVIGNNFPKWTGGFSFGITYKDFELTGLLQGAFDLKRYYMGEASYAFYNSASALKWHLDRWTPEHHDAAYPRITKSDQTNFVTSSFWLQDASYVRLKNITLGYNIPKVWLAKVGVSSAKLFLSGENLLTFDHLKGGLDPEEANERGWSYGNVKKVSVGVRVSF